MYIKQIVFCCFFNNNKPKHHQEDGHNDSTYMELVKGVNKKAIKKWSETIVIMEHDSR